MTKKTESAESPATEPRESGAWLLLKVIAFLFVLPMVLLYAIKLLLV
jgi:hypothetical protein